MATEVKKEVAEPVVTATETIKVEVVANTKSEAAANTDSAAKQKPTGPQPKDIIIDLSPSSRLEIMSTATAEKNQMIVSTGKVSLTRGQVYKIPITNKTLNFDTSYVMKVIRDLRTYIQILDVVEGYVIISPMVHNTILKSGDKIGVML